MHPGEQCEPLRVRRRVRRELRRELSRQRHAHVDAVHIEAPPRSRGARHLEEVAPHPCVGAQRQAPAGRGPGVAIPVGIDLRQKIPRRLIGGVEPECPPAGGERRGAISPPPPGEGQPVPGIAVAAVDRDHQAEDRVGAADPALPEPGVGEPDLGIEVVVTQLVGLGEPLGGDGDGIGPVRRPGGAHKQRGLGRAGRRAGEAEEN